MVLAARLFAFRSSVRLVRLGLFLLLLAGIGQFGICPTVWATKPAGASSSPSVKVYLRSGQGVTGQVTRLEQGTLLMKTPQGEQKIPMNQYQGLVLNTKDELEIGFLVTNNMDAFLEAVQYTQKARQALNTTLNKLLQGKAVCASSAKPFAHFTINRQGKPQNLLMLSRSGCEPINQAITQAIQTTPFPSLSKYYPHDLYVMNYYPTIATSTTPAAPTGAPAAKP